MINDLKERKERLMRKAYPYRYITPDSEKTVNLARQIILPELTDEEIKKYRAKLGSRVFKELDTIEEQFQQITEAINIIGSKIYDSNIQQLFRYINTFREILISIEMNKVNKDYTLPQRLAIMRPEMQRFVSKYEELIKKDEEQTGYEEIKPMNQEGI